MTTHGSHHSSSSRSQSLIPGSSKKHGSSSSSSRMSDTSSSSFRTKSTRKMKFIVAMGIALPILAAIIGVAAWAISAEAVLPGPKSQKLHSQQSNFQPYSHDLVPMIESRSDLEFGQDGALLSSGSHPRPSRVDVDLLPAEASPEGHLGTTEKDPLYIVHFVPTHKPNMEATPVPSNSAASQNILDKILSVSKGAKPGTPQFVVFAPVPEEGDNGESNEVKKGSQISHDRRGVNNYDYNTDVQEDYVYDDVMGGPNGEKSSRPKTISRAGDNLRLSAAPTQEKQNQQATAFQAAFPNATVYKQHPATNYQNSQHSHQQHQPNNIPVQPQLRYPSIPHQQGYPQTQQQNYRLPQPQNYPQPQQQGYPQQSQVMQQSYPQISQSTNQNYAPPQPGQYAQPNYGGAPERSGYVDPNPSPIGIKLNFGTGGGGLKGLLGGGYSPLGLIANILGPRLPRPALNLNGKMMFGVMLENGIKLGGNRPQPSYG